jgi:hypothetical protein
MTLNLQRAASELTKSEIGERGRDIGSIDTRRTVDGRLEHVAVSTAETVRQAIIGAPAPANPEVPCF